MITSGQGADGGARHHPELRQGHDLEGHHARARHARLPERLAARRSRRPRRRTSPGRFTAFIGYEWTSNTGGNNLHRNVIFRDDATKAAPGRAVHDDEAARQRQPGRPLEVDGRATRRRPAATCSPSPTTATCRNGLMFPIVEAFGKPVDRDYAETRAKWERLYEATQTKGDGETHPFLSPNDEFADFETWDKGNLDGSAAKTKDMLRVRVRALGAEERPDARAEARHEPLQVRPDRQQRRAHRPRRDGGGQLLRQDRAAGAEPGAHDARRSSTTRRPA